MHNTHRLEVFSREGMRRLEKKNLGEKKSYFFMKNAGYQLFKFISRKWKKEQPIIVLCGPGNNGGDGFVLAKHLVASGYKIKVYTLLNKKYYKADALKALKEFKGKLEKISLFKLGKKALVIDALFGIGLKRDVKGILVKVFKQINKSKNEVISVDIPSGVCSNTGKILGIAIKANFTVTFHRKKIGHVIDPGKRLSGNIKVVNIGFRKKNEK